MKKYIYLAFGLLIALNLGCAYISYPMFGDNTGSSGPIPAVNTNGKAHITETKQTIALVGGENWENISFIDQTAGGYQRTDTYTIKSTGAPTSHFHSDTYCNPDWTGCAVVTSEYQSIPGNFPPPCAFATYNTKFAYNCGTIAIGICMSYRVQECGRGVGAGMPIADWYNLIGLGQGTTYLGREGLRYLINGRNTEITLSNGATNVGVTLRGNLDAIVVPTIRTMYLDMTDPAMAQNFRSFANKLDELGTSSVSMTINYEGISRTTNIASLSDQARKLANQY